MRCLTLWTVFWFAWSGLALAEEPTVLGQLRLETLQEIALDHPNRRVYAERFNAAQALLTHERLTPVTSMRVGTTASDPFGEDGLQVQAAFGVNIDIIDIFTYPSRVAGARAAKNEQRAVAKAYDRTLEATLRKYFLEALITEDQVQLAQEGLVESTSLRVLAEEQFVDQQVPLEAFSTLITREIEARKASAEAVSRHRQALAALESFLGMSLVEVLAIQHQRDDA